MATTANDSTPSSQPYTVWLDSLGMADIAIAGGKNVSLGEMLQQLQSEGIRVPFGFAVSAAGYRDFLRHNQLNEPIAAILDRHQGKQLSLQETGAQIRQLIGNGQLPPELKKAITGFYQALGQHRKVTQTSAELAVAVRSSATAEDLPEASFAGQQASFLNVRGETQLLQACIECYASLFTDRAISYRERNGFDHMEVALSIGVQEMVHSDSGCAGVMFSIDTETAFPDMVTISASWGLGEAVVQGRVICDYYQVFKPLLKNPELSPIVEKRIGNKLEKLIYSEGGGTQWQPTSHQEQVTSVLNDQDILTLARWASRIEQHYGRPMDMEWAKDGISGELFIVQARPETSASQKNKFHLTSYQLTQSGEILVTGHSIGNAIVSGPCRIVQDSERGSSAAENDFPEGAILVAQRTDPDWLPLMRKAAGVITDSGGPTSHAAIVCRELNIPAIVGTGDATQRLQQAQEVTLSCTQAKGKVYEGQLSFEQQVVDLSSLPSIDTPIMLNMAMPESAAQWWQLPTQGVGLVRIEYIITGMIRAHPMALIHPERIKNPDTRAEVAKLTSQYRNPTEFFVDTLARGLAMIAAYQFPHPAIVRFSDFKTNEYGNLLGGEDFEKQEANPMLGLRGASRYYSDRYRQAFELECQAVKRVREQMGLTNLIVMIPFCRTPGEADRVLEVMADNGLVRGENGLEVYVMCEIPSNVILAEQFAQRFDGFSIGSNDLTQLVLGIDRDSEDLDYLFDARDEAVKTMIRQVIQVAHQAGCKVGICGQAPSDHTDFAEFLIEQGIDSISLNPDSVIKTIQHIGTSEARLKQQP